MSDLSTYEISDDDNEDLIAKAQEESLRYYNEHELPKQKENEVSHLQNENEVSRLQNENKVREADKSLCTQVESGSVLYNGVEAEGFHLAAGSSYIYPTNYPVRQYQASIVKTSLFKNTLVSLPTGLGKTFIAAVVMYNFYRWYPHGKVVFLAPTRPLVAQQTKACHHIMNIPQEHTSEMTGMLGAEQRRGLWEEKRVFFLTPQVMVNDLKSKICPPHLIKCVVFDEAHRATKDYAYCQVLKLLSEANCVFRVVGLSATPGNDISAVQQVISNLQIEALEMRSEESMDVAPYLHSRDIKTVVLQLSGNIQRVKEDLLQVFEKYASKLKNYKLLTYNIASISKFQVLKACEKFRCQPPRNVPQSMVGSLISDFTVCMSLAHSLELLQIYGLRAFYTYLTDDSMDKSKSSSSRLRSDEHLREMLNRLHLCLFPNPSDNIPYTWGHPKLQKLVSALIDHFKKAQENEQSSKAIVFCQYRVVVTEIVEILNKSRPLIKAAEFIGQSGGKERGMPQSKQLQMMKDFRSGLINCLVATCVGEEGLDIGEVDLIVLMEAHKSPVRLVQRLGRTGRKRKGACIVLLTAGKEEQKFKEAMAIKNSYLEKVVNAPAVKSSLIQNTPRMIPPNCSPTQQLVHIQVTNFKSPGKPLKKQVDIRSCMSATPANTVYASDAVLSKAMQELGNKKLCFDVIPKHIELWPRRFGEKISMNEIFTRDVNSFSEWNEWNHEEHESYLLSHSRESKLFCHLLRVASKETPLAFHSLSGIDKEGSAPKDAKKSKSKKETSKKNMGMDIGEWAKGGGSSKKPDLIEILTDSEEAVLLTPSPPNKKAKVSETGIETSLISKNVLSCFEEDKEMCSLFSKYLLPKKKSKNTFSFNKTLPDLNSLFGYLTCDILIKVNLIQEVSDKSSFELKRTLSIETINSQLSGSFVGVDELFSDQEENNVDANKLNVNVKSPDRREEKIGDFSTHENSSMFKDLFIDNNKNNEGIEDILNGQINPNITLSDDDEDIFKNCSTPVSVKRPEAITESKTNKRPVSPTIISEKSPFEDKRFLPKKSKLLYCNGQMDSPKSQNHKTLTSTFLQIHLSNEKIINFDSPSQKSKRENLLPLSPNPPSQDINNIFEKKCSQSGIEKDEKNSVFDPFGLDDDKEFELIEEEILNKHVPTGCSTPLKSTNFQNNEEKPEFKVPSGIASSTPLVSVKKFKKNIVLSQSQGNSQFFPKQESPNAKKKDEILKSPSPSNDWSLSDLFEEEEEELMNREAEKEEGRNKVEKEDSTMLGITQMVSMIEREKGCVGAARPPSHNSPHFNSILESDDDIFTRLSDTIPGRSPPPDPTTSDVGTSKAQPQTHELSPEEPDSPPPVYEELMFSQKHIIKEGNSNYQEKGCERIDSYNIFLSAESNNKEPQSTPSIDNKNSSSESIFESKKPNISPLKNKNLPEKSQNDIPVFTNTYLTKTKDFSSEKSESTTLSLVKPNSGQESQTVNFKRFQKKVISVPKRLCTEDAVPSEKSLSNTEPCPFSFNKEDVLNDKSSFLCSSSEKLHYPSKTERSRNNSKQAASGVSSRVPKSRISLFPRSSHEFSDSSDEDVFRLPTVEKAPTRKETEHKFLEPYLKKDIPVKVSKETVKASKKEVNHKKSKVGTGSGLLETEADVSGDISADDTDGSSLDELDASFIDDENNTEHFTQTMYLKSVRSPVARGQFKIPSKIKCDVDVYSQAIVEPESEYMNDSFCVGSDEESEEAEDRSISFLELAEKRLQNMEEKKKKGKKTGDKGVIGKRKRRRILVESGSEEGSPSPASKSSSRPQQQRRLQSPQHNSSPAFTSSRRLELSSCSESPISSSAKTCRNLSPSDSILEKKIRKLNSKFSKSLEKIRKKYFETSDSSD